MLMVFEETWKWKTVAEDTKQAQATLVPLCRVLDRPILPFCPLRPGLGFGACIALYTELWTNSERS
jgi:hypothetical protein